MVGFLHRFFPHRQEDEAFYSFFRNILGYTPRKIKIYQLAFIHRSKSQTIGQGHRVNNERLEYLGDALLSSIVADFLYHKYPYQGEGFLTEMRSKIVSRSNLNKLANKIGLTQLIQYNRGTTDVYKSIEGDAMEALIAAIYLEKGYKFTHRIVVDKLLNTYMDIDAIEHAGWNYKGKLIDWGQKTGHKVSFVVARTINTTSNGRSQFESSVLIDDTPWYSAIGYSIKSAEQQAAEKTYLRIQSDPNAKPPTLQPDNQKYTNESTIVS